MAEKLILGSKSYLISVRKKGIYFNLEVDEDSYEGEFSKESNGILSLSLNGSKLICYSEKNGNEVYVFANGRNYFFRCETHRTFSSEEEEISDSSVFSPITGKLLSRKVEEGSKVSKGDVILILEAMKMEHRLVSPQDGILTKLTLTDIGGQVKEGDLMFELEDEWV